MNIRLKSSKRQETRTRPPPPTKRPIQVFLRKHRPIRAVLAMRARWVSAPVFLRQNTTDRTPGIKIPPDSVGREAAATFDVAVAAVRRQRQAPPTTPGQHRAVRYQVTIAERLQNAQRARLARAQKQAAARRRWTRSKRLSCWRNKGASGGAPAAAATGALRGGAFRLKTVISPLHSEKA